MGMSELQAERFRTARRLMIAAGLCVSLVTTGCGSTRGDRGAGQAAAPSADVSSANPAVFNQAVTFYAQVTGANSSIAGETVNFYDGLTPIGSGTTAGGTATFTTSSLSAGVHVITAIYVGDATFKPSLAVVLQVVRGTHLPKK